MFQATKNKNITS